MERGYCFKTYKGKERFPRNAVEYVRASQAREYVTSICAKLLKCPADDLASGLASLLSRVEYLKREIAKYREAK